VGAPAVFVARPYWEAEERAGWGAAGGAAPPRLASRSRSTTGHLFRGVA